MLDISDFITRDSARPTAPRSPPHEATTAPCHERPAPVRDSSGYRRKTTKVRIASAKRYKRIAYPMVVPALSR